MFHYFETLKYSQLIYFLIFSGGIVISGLSTGIIIYYNRIIYFLIYFKEGAIINMFLLSLSIKFVKNYTEKNNGVKL